MKSAIEQREKWMKLNNNGIKPPENDGIDDELDTIQGNSDTVYSKLMHQ